LLVVKRGATGHDDEPADYLDAGADRFLESASTDEIVRYVRVLARRLRFNAEQDAVQRCSPGVEPKR
jgi:hypothetical protein